MRPSTTLRLPLLNRPLRLLDRTHTRNHDLPQISSVTLLRSRGDDGTGDTTHGTTDAESLRVQGFGGLVGFGRGLGGEGDPVLGVKVEADGAVIGQTGVLFFVDED